VRTELLAASLLALVFGPPAAAQAPDPSAPELAARLQAHYEKVRDFSARFTHIYEGGVLGRKVTERGTVLVKKPGRMRWTYTSPERKEFVSDGEKIYSYIPEDKQVIVSRMPVEGEATTPALFLAGKGNLPGDFEASFVRVPSAPAGTWALELVPKRREPEYESLVLVVDRKTLAIRMLVSADSQGGESTFVFDDMKENVGLSNKQFNFTIPRGVQVVTDQSKR